MCLTQKVLCSSAPSRTEMKLGMIFPKAIKKKSPCLSLMTLNFNENGKHASPIAHKNIPEDGVSVLVIKCQNVNSCSSSDCP